VRAASRDRIDQAIAESDPGDLLGRRDAARRGAYPQWFRRGNMQIVALWDYWPTIARSRRSGFVLAAVATIVEPP